jgi:glutathione synthase/RimK-type ligase-like ATP-grasp enzyme
MYGVGMNGGAVLIVSSPDDLHARAISSALNSEFGQPAVIWDTGTIPAESHASFHLAETDSEFEVETPDGTLNLNSLRSVWWRRPGDFRLDKGVKETKVQEFCVRECSSFLRGALSALQVPIVNNPAAQGDAARKPKQLSIAKRLGLTIPVTLMSNNPQEIRSFWERLSGNCIYKAFTPPSGELAETRPLTEYDLGFLDQVRHAPIIVQERIEKGCDVRVNVFGQRVFAASVTTHIPQAELDWRLDILAAWSEHKIPDDISEKLILLVETLGLHYGCIDLRQRPDGTYVFLEVNPAGQFLFIEVATGQPLARSFAELLLQPGVGMPHQTTA